MRSFFLVLLMACGSPEAPTPAPAAPAPVAVKPAPAPAPAAAPAAPVVVKKGNAEAGKEVFTTNCVSCHQADGTGMGGMLAADFTKEKERLAKTDAELLGSIANGVTGKKGVMPGWRATLSDQQMADALAYIRVSFGGD